MWIKQSKNFVDLEDCFMIIPRNISRGKTAQWKCQRTGWEGKVGQMRWMPAARLRLLVKPLAGAESLRRSSVLPRPSGDSMTPCLSSFKHTETRIKWQTSEDTDCFQHFCQERMRLKQQWSNILMHREHRGRSSRRTERPGYVTSKPPRTSLEKFKTVLENVYNFWLTLSSLFTFRQYDLLRMFRTISNSLYKPSTWGACLMFDRNELNVNL